jgi:hypothetical protein
LGNEVITDLVAVARTTIVTTPRSTDDPEQPATPRLQHADVSHQKNRVRSTAHPQWKDAGVNVRSSSRHDTRNGKGDARSEYGRE